MRRIPWTKIVVRLGLNGPPLDGSARLAELWRWLRGEASPQFVFLADEQLVADARAVNWDQFPLQEALDAAEAQEKLRHTDRA